MTEPTETHVVTCFLRHRGEVLLLRRSAEVGSYAGQWGTVAGHAEGNPDAAARTEIDEETGLADAVTLVRRGDSFPVEDPVLNTRWVVHPYLFESAHRAVTLNWESVEAEWVMPTEILRRDTVPQLWTSYEHVAPTAASIAADRTHGSAYIALRALEVLRDRAGVLQAEAPPDAADHVRDTAHALLKARPAMAAVGNHIHRVMQAVHPACEPAEVEATAHAAIARALDAGAATAHHAGRMMAGQRILTLSRSGTVRQALRVADPPPEVVVAESRPEREGVDVAEALAANDLAVTLCTDAAVADVLVRHDIDAVVVGADTVLASGDVVNKTGTRGTALAAHHAAVPVYVVAATAKISPDNTPRLEDGPATAIYDGPATLRVLNPTFDVTPAAAITRWVTDEGALPLDAVRRLADEHAHWRHWMTADTR